SDKQKLNHRGKGRNGKTTLQSELEGERNRPVDEDEKRCQADAIVRELDYHHHSSPSMRPTCMWSLRPLIRIDCSRSWLTQMKVLSPDPSSCHRSRRSSAASAVALSRDAVGSSKRSIVGSS